MIDVKKTVSGYKAFIAGEMLLAAAVVLTGMFIQGPAGGDKGSAAEISAAESTQALSEASAEGGTEMAASSSTALSTETAALVEPEDRENGQEQSAAYTRIQEDGQYASEVMTPGGNEIYSERELILINPWHLLPEDYEVDLEDVEYGHRMDACAAEHLRDMLADCRAQGLSPLICSSYRERSKQERLFENDVRILMYRGMTEEEAREETAKNVAVPGSSEHEAGLAVDIVYLRYQVLDESQENNETQQWLMEHCWEYGFILRYPCDKQEITGITYEPWHYRYVGMEAAREIMSEGICLEEYLGVIDAEPGQIASDEHENYEDEESGYEDSRWEEEDPKEAEDEDSGEPEDD